MSLETQLPVILQAARLSFALPMESSTFFSRPLSQRHLFFFCHLPSMFMFLPRLVSKTFFLAMVLVFVSNGVHNWFWFRSLYDVRFGFGFTHEEKIDLNWFWFRSFSNYQEENNIKDNVVQ